MKSAIVVALSLEMMTIPELLAENRLNSTSLSGYAMAVIGSSRTSGQTIGIWKVNFARQGR